MPQTGIEPFRERGNAHRKEVCDISALIVQLFFKYLFMYQMLFETPFLIMKKHAKIFIRQEYLQIYLYQISAHFMISLICSQSRK